MEQFRDRLVDFRSLNDIQQLIREFTEFELTEAVTLPYFVVRSVLEGVHERLSGRPLETATWSQVKDALSGPMENVVDAHHAGDQGVLFKRLNTLVRQWALARKELTE